MVCVMDVRLDDATNGKFARVSLAYKLAYCVQHIIARTALNGLTNAQGLDLQNRVVTTSSSHKYAPTWFQTMAARPRAH